MTGSEKGSVKKSLEGVAECFGGLQDYRQTQVESWFWSEYCLVNQSHASTKFSIFFLLEKIVDIFSNKIVASYLKVVLYVCMF